MKRSCIAFVIPCIIACGHSSEHSATTTADTSGAANDGTQADGPADTGEDSGVGETADIPDLPGDCSPATFTCSEDGHAQLACGWDPEQSASGWGWRIPCGDGESCSAGTCEAAGCRSPELLFVVDRSDSMLEGGRWTWVSQALDDFGTTHGAAAQQGVRMFPDEPCQPGSIAPIESRPGGFAALLDPPSAGASTPIRAALSELAPAFGDPDQGQAVILVTDGDETCEPGSSPALEASNLFRLGIRVYAIAVSTQANKPLLDEIAALGGTVTARQVDDANALGNVLSSILEDLDACACQPGLTTCSNGATATCDADGLAFGASEPCPSGMCADSSACEPLACLPLCDEIYASYDLATCVVGILAGTSAPESCLVPEDLGGPHCLECLASVDCNAVAQACM